jgi:predicted Zn-dependent peptidase
MAYQINTLSNGVRIASCEMPHMRSVSVGIWVAVGGRHEPADLCGISHFLEHLLFKGTERRTPRQLTEAVEGVGGFINAFTTEDHTCFYAKAGAQHLPVLADVLTDMFRHSVFAEQEIERERDVIREEILMYRDQPSQYAQELLTEVMWPDHPLGRPLTGSIESITRINRPELCQYVGDCYTGKNTFVTVAGRCSHATVVEQFGKGFNGLLKGGPPRFAVWNGQKRPKRLIAAEEDTEQTHVALGYHAMSRTDERRHALKILSVILGENMSSRLFQQLRERYAYCYSIHSGTLVLEDSGMVNICVGLEPGKFPNALRAIARELNKVKERAPTKAELRRAQEYTIGQNDLSLESTTNQIMWMGESLVAYDRIIDPEQVQEKIKAVTPEAIQEVANVCFVPERLGVAVVGPLPMEKVNGWLEQADL